MMMTHHAVILSQPPVIDMETNKTVTSRFGDLIVDTRNAINFSRGLLGIPQQQEYVLANFPGEKMQQFKLLQSLEDGNLSFLTLPLEIDNPIIARDDVVLAAQALGISVSNLALLLVVSVYRTPGQTKITVNARAPLFVDAEKKWGVQYVFPHSKYKVQHVIKE